MKQEIIEEIIEEMNREEKLTLVYFIIKEENLSIAEIVKIKETALTDKIAEDNTLMSGLAWSASALFSDKEQQDRMKASTAKHLIKTGIFSGTKFEKTLQDNRDYKPR